MLRYPLSPPYLPPACEVLATLSQQQDFTPPAIQCDHIYALLATSRRPAQLASPARTASRYVSTAIGWLSWSSAICLRSGG